MAFTEFYCNSSGSNVNAGSRTTVIGGASDAPAYTATNGAWDKDSGSNEGTFTPASGNPSTTVSAGDFGAIYADGGSVAAAVMLVKSVTSTTIVFDQTKFAGVIPADAANGISCKVGGAWLGPNSTVGFPFDFVLSSLTNATGDTPRVNMNGTFSVTSAITHSKAGPIRFEGYGSAAGDGTRATLDGGTTTALMLLTLSGSSNELVGIIFTNGKTDIGSPVAMVNVSGTLCHIGRCVFHTCRQIGLYVSGNTNSIVECEAYGCNVANTSGYGGFYFAGTGLHAIRCISHDNAGNASVGFKTSTLANLSGCIADTNGGQGFLSDSGCVLIGCDAYNNGSDGLRIANTSSFVHYIENCNFVLNGGYGINGSGSGARYGDVVNCGFGTGTKANTSGTTTGLKSMREVGSVNHTANETPWVDPADGDFRITLSTAKNAGRGTFTQTQSGYGDPNATVAYNDIGAARHADPAGGGGGGGPLIGGRLVQ